MHQLLENGLATEVHGPQCISYVLEQDGLFNLSEYKIIQNQKATHFVDFAKYTYNGKVKLVYFIEEYVSLKSIATAIESYPFVNILANLMCCVIDTVHNGYLDVNDLNLEFNRIYVNPNTLEVKLIYLPVNGRHFGGTVVMGIPAIDEMRSNLVKLICSTPNLISAKTREICSWLSDGFMSLEEIYSKIRAGNSGHLLRPVPKAETKMTLVLSAMNSPGKVEFVVNKDSFTLGRNAADADGHISFNPTVSGVHCRIVKTTAGFAVEDLNSRNGTFVNNAKIHGGARADLKNGDILRLSNSDFTVSIREG